MCILNITKAIQKMSVNYIRDFLFENYYGKKKGFLKENSYYSSKCLKKDLLLLAKKLIEKIPDPCNAKEYCQTFT